MKKPPLSTAITSLLGVLVPASFLMPAFAGDGSSSRQSRMSTSTTETVVTRELQRRHEELDRGIVAIEAGDRAMKERDYETAFAQYRRACDDIPNATNTGRYYNRALRGLCDAGVDLAEQKIAEGRYQDAENVLKLVLDERYDPNCKPALKVLHHLEQPDYYNKTVTPKFRASVEQVKQLMLEAKGFYDTARWQLAEKRCEQVLNVDPYNIAARKMEEEIYRKKDDYANEAYNEARAHAIWQVTHGWETPVRRFDSNHGNTLNSEPIQIGNQARIRQKLATIIIPKLEFRDATIREAIDYLKRRSVDLDPEHTGVNIVLNLNETGGSGDLGAAVPAAPAAAVIPGIDPGAGAAPAPVSPAAPAGNPNEARITLSLSSVPLSEALRYVTTLASLKYKVDEYAVTIVPLTVPTEVLVAKEWKVPPGMFAGASGAAASGALDAPAAAAGAGAAGGDRTRGSGSSLTTRIDAKDFFTANGVTFPVGASATFIASASKLIVRNTQENLDLIDQIINAFTSLPAQVEIEAKFVEIQQNNLKELSFDWLLGQANVPGSSRVFAGGGTTGTASGVDPNNFPFPVGSGTRQTFPVTSSLRNGSLAISQNAIDALLAGTSGVGGASPAVAALSGVFTDPQFQLVIHALNQKKGIDLLSAPRVTAKSGQHAVIEIIREFRYPTEFQPPQIPQTFGNQNGGTQFVTAGGLNPLAAQSQSSFPVTPTTPTAFETRNTGVTLECAPVIGADNVSIDLDLVPQVVEFEGFINYGSPIQTTSTNALGQSITNIITPNVINQPIFSTRKVTTSVTIFDGQTVVLGGLMREDVQKVEDKIPLLGDVPLFGRLFRSNSEQHLKTNLVIFVSARLINPAGEAIHIEDETEDVVQTLPTPEVTEPALPLMPK